MNSSARYNRSARISGAYTVITHGAPGFTFPVYAEGTPDGEAAIDAWIAGQPGMAKVGGAAFGYFAARVSSTWLAANWKADSDASKAITIWSICFSATAGGGEAAVKEAAGGRWRSGFLGTCDWVEAVGVNKKFFERMNGTTDNNERRTAGEAYNGGFGYTSNLKMDGNDWTTLCPAPLHVDDGPVFPDSDPGLRFGWGCIIFDTYMEDSFGPELAFTTVSGGPTGDHRWAAQTPHGFFTLGFHYDKTSGTATTMRANAPFCRNKDPDLGREMDGNRVKPNNDNREWSY